MVIFPSAKARPHIINRKVRLKRKKLSRQERERERERERDCVCGVGERDGVRERVAERKRD